MAWFCRVSRSFKLARARARFSAMATASRCLASNSPGFPPLGGATEEAYMEDAQGGTLGHQGHAEITGGQGAGVGNMFTK